MENLKYIILGIAVLMYVLVIAFQEKKVWFTSIAAAAVILLGIILPGQIFPIEGMANGSALYLRSYALTHSIGEIINWNVILIYLGSMTIAALFLYSNVPARIADSIINSSKNTGFAIVLILAMTGIISIFVENVATVLVMAPIALALCKKLKMNPTYFMIGLAVMSNLEGTATLVGDPPSMIFAAYAGYSFNDFFVHAGKLSIFFIIQAGLLVGCVYFYCFFAKIGKEKIQVEKTNVISWVPFIILLAMIFGLATVSFIPVELPYLSGLLVLALGIISLLWFHFSQKKTMKDVWELVKGLDWETIFFLLGIFVVVGAIQEIGLLEDFALLLAKMCGGSELLAYIVILAVSVIISGFVDNVPYIIAMLPVAGSMAVTMGINKELLMFALLIGSCLGGNLTPFGASANVVSMGIVKKEGYPMKFSGWLKVAVPFTVLTTGVAALVLWLLWA
ncbi:MAG: TRAP transporter large permease subunit [Spirochaetia bacterium]|nr:TRAP transporter large permease subunit [Spirochaetia bacterium]